MKEYLEKTLRQIVTIKENNDLYDKLPLAFKGRYDILNVETTEWAGLRFNPKNDTDLLLSERTGLKFRIFQD